MRTLTSLPTLLAILVAALATPAAAQNPTDSNAAKDDPAERIRAATNKAILTNARNAIRQMGNYRARLIKTERIKGEVRPAQTIDLLVRSSPRAVRLEFVAGPKSGRRVIWREDLRSGEILAREGGILGVTSLWLDASGGLARGDTNHAVSEIGFSHVLDVMESDFAKGEARGGHARKDLGPDANGLYRIDWIAPPGTPGLYAQRTRVAIDLKLQVPVEIEVFDAQGLLEKYEYKNVRTRQTFRTSDFEEL
jgi:hypothetical protein